MTFPWPTPGTPLSEVATPMPVIDEARMEANIARAQSYMDAHGLRFRPHIKTHKIPFIARAQLAAGAVGITCQKLTEAEVFADAGFDDILITYNMLGAARLRALNDRVRLTVVADSAEAVDGLAATFGADRPLRVLVECDTGAKRCGVTQPEEAVALAQRIAAAPGLRFKGYAVVDLFSACEVRPAIGDVLHVIPNHTCPVSNLFDRVVFHRNGIVTRIEAVAARGMVR